MRKLERFVVATDPHGDMADPNSVSALWDFVHDWKPTIRIHAGDVVALQHRVAPIVDRWR